MSIEDHSIGAGQEAREFSGTPEAIVNTNEWAITSSRACDFTNHSVRLKVAEGEEMSVSGNSQPDQLTSSQEPPS